MIDDKCSGIATAEEQNLEAERFIEELDASNKKAIFTTAH